MQTRKNDWALVLAAGSGTRLSALTTDDGGRAVPKQYCALRGQRTLLGDALERARRLVPRERIVVVVAAEHERWWTSELADLPPENVVIQPQNRGTAPGILLPTLAILERDPRARIAVLPSDHFAAKEYVLEVSLRLALETLDDLGDGLVLLGIRPDGPETDYGWIVPQGGGRRARAVAAFVEKPPSGRARELLERGGLWNSFLFVVTARSLVRMYQRHAPGLLAAFRDALLSCGPAERPRAVARLYAELGEQDFSRELLQVERDLLVMEVPACGWTDLGTPQRVARCLEQVAAGVRAPLPADGVASAPKRSVLDLSFALGLQQAALAGAQAL